MQTLMPQELILTRCLQGVEASVGLEGGGLVMLRTSLLDAPTFLRARAGE
jgi:hypothetical protein